MSKLDELKVDAMDACQFRGHQMGEWMDAHDGKSSISTCTICNKYVLVETDPAPNGINIGGPAVAVGCED